MSPRVVPPEVRDALNRQQRNRARLNEHAATLDRSIRVENNATGYEIYRRAELLEQRSAHADLTALMTSADAVGKVAFWKYCVGALADDGRAILDSSERRTLSRASGAAGAFLVPDGLLRPDR